VLLKTANIFLARPTRSSSNERHCQKMTIRQSFSRVQQEKAQNFCAILMQFDARNQSSRHGRHYPLCTAIVINLDSSRRSFFFKYYLCPRTTNIDFQQQQQQL